MDSKIYMHLAGIRSDIGEIINLNHELKERWTDDPFIRIGEISEKLMRLLTRYDENIMQPLFPRTVGDSLEYIDAIKECMLKIGFDHDGIRKLEDRFTRTFNDWYLEEKIGCDALVSFLEKNFREALVQAMQSDAAHVKKELIGVD